MSPNPHRGDSTNPGWPKRVSVFRYERVKLFLMIGGTAFLAIYLGSNLGPKRAEVDETRDVPAGPVETIQEDSLPLNPARKAPEEEGIQSSIEGHENEESEPSEGGIQESFEGNGDKRPQGEANQPVGPVAFPLGPEVMNFIEDRTRSLEQDPYYYLLHQVNQLPENLLGEKANSTLTWREVFNNPQEYRSKIVKVKGNLLNLKVISLDKDITVNPTGLSKVYYGQIVDKDFRFWTFILTEKPDEKILVKEKELVVVFGFFFKVWEYETNIQNAYKLTPVVVGRTMRQVHLNPNPTTGLVVMVIVALTALGLFIAVRWDKSLDRKVNKERRKKVIGRRPPEIDQLARKLSGQAAEERNRLFEGTGDRSGQSISSKTQETSAAGVGPQGQEHEEKSGESPEAKGKAGESPEGKVGRGPAENSGAKGTGYEREKGDSISFD